MISIISVLNIFSKTQNYKYYNKNKKDTMMNMPYEVILERIKELGLYEDSIIIFSSDHGVGLDKQRGLASYSRTYNANLQIPFLIKFD